jgi:hypothetical protein
MISEKAKGLLEDQCKTAALKENYSEDKLIEDEQQFILKELGRVF